MVVTLPKAVPRFGVGRVPREQRGVALLRSLIMPLFLFELTFDKRTFACGQSRRMRRRETGVFSRERVGDASPALRERAPEIGQCERRIDRGRETKGGIG